MSEKDERDHELSQMPYTRIQFVCKIIFKQKYLCFSVISHTGTVSPLTYDFINYAFFYDFYGIQQQGILLLTKATQLILTKVQSEKFSISRGPVEFLICDDKNETIIASEYRKILGFSHSLYSL